MIIYHYSVQQVSLCCRDFKFCFIAMVSDEAAWGRTGWGTTLEGAAPKPRLHHGDAAVVDVSVHTERLAGGEVETTTLQVSTKLVFPCIGNRWIVWTNRLALSWHNALLRRWSSWKDIMHSYSSWLYAWKANTTGFGFLSVSCIIGALLYQNYISFIYSVLTSEFENTETTMCLICLDML